MMRDLRALLSGAEVNSALRFMPSVLLGKMRNRDSALVAISRGKDVLHVGFLDHSAEIRFHKKQGWLHALLTPSAKRLTGLDIDRAQIDELAQRGVENLYTYEDLPVDSVFEVVLVPDVIEHVENVHMFLSRIGSLNASEFVFSTPNGLSLQNRFRFKSEIINSDHLQLFTPWTLQASLFRAGFELVSLEMSDTSSRFQILRNTLKAFFPMLRSDMIMTVKRAPSVH